VAGAAREPCTYNLDADVEALLEGIENSFTSGARRLWTAWRRPASKPSRRHWLVSAFLLVQKKGDVCEVEIEGIGTLHNSIDDESVVNAQQSPRAA
jgi:hypothetical protein